MTARTAAPVPGGTIDAAPATVAAPPFGRWGQLVIGVICMVMIANLQYGWTFFVPDIQKKFGFDRAAIQWAFTLF
ncbi:MAG: oxalate/formate MFS antiporter, partial [Methylobacterium sp.]|nr:oxalate/formate MFS antiporter [Methylobacterium sp.]